MKESIYLFLERTKEKDTSGHYLNKYKCKECGQIFIKRKGFAIKTYNCHHNFNRNKKIQNEDKNERLYKIFQQMKNRCYNFHSKDYKRYGKKGIKIYEKWLCNFYEFQKWALLNGYEDTLTIDRINCNGNYEPNNCRWVSKEENSRFKSTTNFITLNGITKSGSQWSKEIKKGRNYINNMLRKKGYEYTINFLKDNL